MICTTIAAHAFLQNYEELSDSIIDESEKFAVVLPAQIS